MKRKGANRSVKYILYFLPLLGSKQEARPEDERSKVKIKYTFKSLNLRKSE